MKKRILSAVLAGMMVCAAVPAVFAAESEVKPISEPLKITTVSIEDDQSAAYALYSKGGQVRLADDDQTDQSGKDPKITTVEVEGKKFPKYNSKDEGLVTSVKDQGVDGDCWAYAATAVFETSLLKKGIVKDASTLDLSEKHLTDNTYNLPKKYENDDTQPKPSNPWSFDYTSMGNSTVSTSYFTRGSGPVSDTGDGDKISSYDNEKYGVNTNDQAEYYANSIVKIPDVIRYAKPSDASSENEELYGIKLEDGHTITNPADFTEEIENNSYVMKSCLLTGDESATYTFDSYRYGFYTQMELIKKEILDKGAVYSTLSTQSTVEVKDDFGNPIEDNFGNPIIVFDYYLFNKETNAFYNYIFSDIDHAVTIVGWDDDYSRENFVNPPEYDGAWIVKNSWGANQLAEGYMYVSYYDTQICTDVITIDAGERNKDEKIFQHDAFGATGISRTIYDIGKYKDLHLWVLNRFKNEKIEDQVVDKVGVFIHMPNTTCNIYVNSNEENTQDNISGIGRNLNYGDNGISQNGFRNKKPAATKTFELEGYYVIELDEPVNIFGDFEVAVEYECAEDSREYTYDDKGTLYEVLTFPVEIKGDNSSKAGATATDESYFGIDYGENVNFDMWHDMYDAESQSYSNACIKAFTTIKPATDKYDVADLSASDVDGNPITGAFLESGSFLVETSVKKVNNTVDKNYLIIVSYDERGAFINFSYLVLDNDITVGETRRFGTMIGAADGRKVGSVKAFVWNGLNSAQPVSNSVEFKPANTGE